MNKAQAKRMAFTENNEGITTRGEGLKKETWYSISSRHSVHDNNCDMCKTGSWHNDHKLAVEGWIHDHFYWFWHFWINNI